MTNQPSGHPTGQAQIQIADNIPGAEYTNLAQINHDKEEFQIFFANVVGPTGKVVAKVITSPGHFKRLINAMGDNLKKYEERFGAVTEAENIEREIGFKG